MYPFEPDSVKDIKAEEQAYRTWVKDKKNHILNMADSQKKQTAWSKLFPPFHSDDSWLEEAVIF